MDAHNVHFLHKVPVMDLSARCPHQIHIITTQLTCSIRLIDHGLDYSPPRVDKPETKAYSERGCQKSSK